MTLREGVRRASADEPEPDQAGLAVGFALGLVLALVFESLLAGLAIGLVAGLGVRAELRPRQSGGR